MESSCVSKVNHALMSSLRAQEFKAKTDDSVYKGGLPVLTVDGKKFAQSSAILRYAGRKGKMYSEDPVVAMRIDEVIDTYQDIMGNAPKGLEQDALKAAREEYAAGGLQNFMQRLSDCASESASEWIAGTADMSIADLAVWQLTSMLRSGDFSHIPSDYTDKWPLLVKIEKAVPEHAAFKAWQAVKAARK